MLQPLVRLLVPALLLGTLAYLSATAAQETAAAHEYDVNQELEKLKGWKDYLSAELEKCKSESSTALQAEQHRIAEYAAQVAQLTQTVTEVQTRLSDADAKATAAEASAAQATSKAAEAEALAASYSTYSEQLKTQIEQLQQELAGANSKVTDAESKASANAAAANAANGESAALRKQLADAVSERQALEARVAELASATNKAGGLRGHALAIFDILVAEAAKHKDTAVNYANEKLPGFKAKVAGVQAVVTAGLNNATELVGHVEGELKPWLRGLLVAVPALKQYGEDPVVLQAVVYAVLGAPLLLVLPLLSIFYRLVARRPAQSSGRVPEGKSSRNKKKRQQA